MYVGNALITKIKTIHANDLKENDYKELLKKSTITDITTYLKKHPAYQEILAGIPESAVNRSRLEALIRRQKFDQMMRIIKFLTTDDKSFYLLSLVHQEHNVLLAMIRSFISSEVYDVVADLPVYFDRYSKIDFNEIAKTTNMKEFVQALVGTKYQKMLKPYENIKNEGLKYYEFESLFESDYYKYAFEHINKNYKGRLKEELEHVFKSRIEMENMIKVYRLKKFYQVPDEEIRMMLVPTTRILQKKLDEVISIKDPNEIFNRIIDAGYRQYIGDKDQAYLEYFGDHLRYHIAKKLMYYASHPAKVYLGYMILSELEVSNLTHLIEGIRYQVAPEEIRMMMVY